MESKFVTIKSFLILFFLVLSVQVQGQIMAPAKPPQNQKAVAGNRFSSAADSISFTLNQSGTRANYTLSGSLLIAPSHMTNQGRVYVAAFVPTLNKWFFLKSNSSWVEWNQGAIPYWFAGSLVNQNISIAQQADLSNPAFDGTSIIVGYSLGADESNMLSTNRYKTITTLLKDGVLNPACLSTYVTAPGQIPDLAQIELDILIKTNEYRRSKGLPNLTINPILSALARGHSMNMAKGLYGFGHDHFQDRVAAASCLGVNMSSGAAENAANTGLIDGGGLVQGWIGSPGHQRNLVGDYLQIGIGVYQVNGHYYATQLFF